MFRKQYAPQLTNLLLFARWFDATEISYLVSPLLLYNVNDAFDRDNRQYFFNNDGRNIICHSFIAVTEENIDLPA